MPHPFTAAKKLSLIILILVFSSLCYFIILAQPPDLDLHFEREITSELETGRLDRNISSVTRWPQWFFSLTRASIEDGTSDIKVGSTIFMEIDPGKGRSKKFTLSATVTEYVPGKILKMKILSDSTQRLTRLFDRLEWALEFIPGPNGTLIRGTAEAHTCSWRSRFFGRLVEKSLMNQIYYPNIVKLSLLKQPFSMDLNPAVSIR